MVWEVKIKDIKKFAHPINILEMLTNFGLDSSFYLNRVTYRCEGGLRKYLTDPV